MFESDSDDIFLGGVDSDIDEMMFYLSSPSSESPEWNQSIKSDEYINLEMTRSTKPPTIIKKRRFRPNKKRYLARLFPRVIKRDLRRLYPMMLVNILNAADPILIRSFFQTYSVPTLDIIGEKKVLVNNSYVLKPSMGDVDSIVNNIAVEHELMPDLTVQMNGAYIKQFLNDKSHSEVMCQIMFSGTKLFRYERTSSCNKKAIEIDEYLDNCCSSQPMRNSQEEHVDAYTPHKSSFSMSHKLLLSNPFEIFLKGMLTLRVDDRNRISGMKFENCS